MTQSNSLVHSSPAPIFRLQGSHREIGRQLGEQASEQIKHSIEAARVFIEKAVDYLQLDWQGAQIQSRKYIPFAQERYPRYVEELMGMADGAGVSFDDIALVNAMEAVTSDALHLEKCTSMAVNETRTADGHVLAVHNEDWLPWDETDVYLVHAMPDDEPAFLAMSYGCLLPNIGINSFGLGQCCDSVYPRDSRIGIPRVIVSRAVLGSRSISQAIRHMVVPHRAAGYNHLLVHESGEMYNIEVSARQFAILPAANGALVHTNHYLDPKMQAIEQEPDEMISTRVRYHRAVRLLTANPKHTLKSLQEIQQDHVNYPDSICNHDDDTNAMINRQKTINALILDVTSRSIHLAWGNPCVNHSQTYFLEADA
jgi:isopenicillin-N N-acyltransferase-like protein